MPKTINKNCIFHFELYAHIYLYYFTITQNEHQLDVSIGSLHAAQRSLAESKYGFSNETEAIAARLAALNTNGSGGGSMFYGTVPELPPRIDRGSKPPGGGPYPMSPPNGVSSSATNTPGRTNMSGGTLGRSAQERLFGTHKSDEFVNESAAADYSSRGNLLNASAGSGGGVGVVDKLNGSTDGSLDRQQMSSLDRSGMMRAGGGGTKGNNTTGTTGSYDSMSSYDSCNTTQISMQQRLGPNAPDDLKSVPPARYGC